MAAARESRSSSKRNILVIVTAGDCPACKFFKSKRRDLLDIVNREKLVKIEEINFPNKHSPPDFSSYHPDLVKYIGWFPEFIIFTKESWNNHSIPLKGYVLNGVYTFESGGIVPGSLDIEDRQANIDIRTIVNWIRQTVQTILSPDDAAALSPRRILKNSKSLPVAVAQIRYIPGSDSLYKEDDL